MTDSNKRGLGRGLAALIPTNASPRERYRPGPVDAYFPPSLRGQDTKAAESGDEPSSGATSPPAGGPAAAASASPDTLTGDTMARGVPAARSASSTDAPAAPPTQAPTPAPAVPSRTRETQVEAPAAGWPSPQSDRPAGWVDPSGSASEGETGTEGHLAEPQGSRTPEASAAPGDTGDTSLQDVPGVSVAEIPLDQILPNAQQPRQVFDEDEIVELARSIATVGLLQPIVVRPIAAVGSSALESPAESARYELIMGERRWRACRAAGLATVPAIVRQTDDEAMLRDALLENLHRVQLNPLEEAAAYQQLLQDFGCTHEDLADRLSRSRPQVSNTLRLLRLPALVQQRVAAGVLSAGHARALLGLDAPAAMERLAQRIVAEGLSVRAVEEIVALGEDSEPAGRRRGRQPIPVPENAAAIATRLTDQLETSVSVAMGRKKGKLTIEFASVEDLERIGSLLGVEVGSSA